MTTKDRQPIGYALHVTRGAIGVTNFWADRSLMKATSTGFATMIGDKLRIITNYHCVELSKDIVIEIRGKKYDLIVEHLIPEFEIAVLAFTVPVDKIKPLNISDTVTPGDAIVVHGFPYGGVDISIASGVYNRIEEINYNNFNRGPVLCSSASMAGGNSGSPALNAGGDVIGVVFAHEKDRNDRSLLVPGFVLRMLFRTIEQHGQYTGLTEFTHDLLACDRAYLLSLGTSPESIPDGHNDFIRITRASGRDNFITGDIIYAVNGARLQPGSLVETSYGFRISLLSYLYFQKCDTRILFSVLRESSETVVELLTVNSRRSEAIIPLFPAFYNYSYVFVHNLLLIELNECLFRTNPEYRYLKKFMKQTGDDKIVVIADVLGPDHKYYTAHRILTVNGNRIRNLSQLYDVYTNILANGPDIIRMQIEKGNTEAGIKLTLDISIIDGLNTQKKVSGYYPGMLWSSYEIMKINALFSV